MFSSPHIIILVLYVNVNKVIFEIIYKFNNAQLWWSIDSTDIKILQKAVLICKLAINNNHK